MTIPDIGTILKKWPRAWRFITQDGARYVEIRAGLYAKFERVAEGWRRSE